MRYYLQWAIAYAFALASATAASLFGFLSSVGPYAYVKAGVLCLVAFAGCHGPAWATRLRQAYGPSAAFLGGLAAFACLIVTLWGGLGTMASGGEEVRAERAKAAADADIDREALARALSQRRALPATRPSAAVRPLATQAREGSAYKAKLEAELATAEQGERLDAEIARLEERLRRAPPPVVADPEAAAFAQLFSVSVATAAALKALLVSLALEAAAMVAMLVAWAEKRQPPQPEPISVSAETLPPLRVETPRPAPIMRRMPAPRPAPPPKPREQLVVPKVFGSVKKFVGQCTIPHEGERLEIRAMLARYRQWCQEHSLTPADLDRFLDEIASMFTVEPDGDKVYATDVMMTG